MQLPKLMIFDMDGLLFNSEELFMNQKTIVMKEYGYMEHRREDYIQTLGLAGEALNEKLLEIYGADYPAEEISRKTRKAVQAYAESYGPEIKPGIPELLDWLKERQIPCCVASSSLSSTIQLYLEKTGLDSYFDFIIGADHITHSKPDPEIFLKACQKAGVAPEDAMVLEDSQNGILAAHKGNIPVICIPDMKEPEAEYRQMALAVLPSAFAVIDYFKGIYEVTRMIQTKKLGFGLMRLPKKANTTEYDLDLIRDMIDTFLKEGFNYFDTAFIYDGGRSEKVVKDLLVNRYPRESFYLTTKLNAWLNCPDAETARQQLSISLERTGAGYFDLYLLHGLQAGNYELYDKYGTWDFIKEAKDQGLVHHIGFSFHGTPELLDELLTKHPEVDYVQLQINYIDWEDPAVLARQNYEVARKHGKEIIVMEPIKGGLLANPPADAVDVLHQANPQMSTASWALRFAASLDGVLTVLSGMNAMEQMKDNISFMKDFVPLNKDEMNTIACATKAIKQHRMVPCTACCYCVSGCPQHIMMPELFDILNIYMTYRDLHTAKHHYEMHTVTTGKASDCVHCHKCEKACPQHLEITKLLEQCAELFEQN